MQYSSKEELFVNTKCRPEKQMAGYFYLKFLLILIGLKAEFYRFVCDRHNTDPSNIGGQVLNTF